MRTNFLIVFIHLGKKGGGFFVVPKTNLKRSAKNRARKRMPLGDGR